MNVSRAMTTWDYEKGPIGAMQLATLATISPLGVVHSLEETIEKIVAVAIHVGSLDLDAVLEIDTAKGLREIAAVAELKAAAIRDLHRTSEEAVKAAAALEGLAVEAKRKLGEALRKLDEGKPGGVARKSERTLMAEAIGLDPRESRRYVDLGAIPKEKIDAIRAEFDAKDKRVTVRGVLAAAESPNSTEGCSSDDYYTPPSFTDDVRLVFDGAIDCDPESCLLAQCASVRARRWYSIRSPLEKAEQDRALEAGIPQAQIDEAIEQWGGIGGEKDNRLTQNLAGSIYANLRYSRPAPGTYTTLDGFQSGLVREAVLLLNTATSSQSQQDLLRASSAQLWVGKGEKHDRTRIAFIRPDGTPHKGNMYDQAAFYLGQDPTKFAEIMDGWGVVTVTKSKGRRG